MIFIDTSVWIAIEDKKNLNHSNAALLKQELLKSHEMLISFAIRI